MQINPNDFYMILLKDKPVIPDNFDAVMDYWTAETVKAFIEHLNPNQRAVIQKVSFIDIEQLKKGGLDE